MGSSKHVVIVGAGPAGSLLTIFLAQRGFEVDVYERRPDMRKIAIPAGRSINLALAERGIQPLRRAGVFPQVEKLLIPMRGRMVHTVDGNVTLQRYGQREDEVIHSVSRRGLNALLMDAAERHDNVRFHFNQRCIDFDFNKAKAIFRNEDDGSEQSVPITPCVAADGTFSVVRRSMQALPGFTATEDLLGHSYKELTLPPDARDRHQIETNALHIWPRGGFMLIALPNLDGSFTVTLFLATEGQQSFASLTGPDSLQAFFHANFPDAHALIPDLERDFFVNPTGSLMTVRCLPWHVGSMAALVGDAAHAVVPFHGQGMNCAFEDCAELDECLEAFGPDWQKVFQTYESRRKPNAEAIADMALENYVEMRDQVRDTGFVLKTEIAWELERRYPNRFIPRYSMVMFHHEIPYAEAKRRGAIQSQILDDLVADCSAPNEIDYGKAATLIELHLDPLDNVA
ncbi:MAG: NAD(P)/FAD-dependent oxidoreductase [Gammaproteobacteria bacterium]